MKIFKKYASFYDALYHDKDYMLECDFLEKVFKKYSHSKVKSILDLGCGTGGHAIILAKRGYRIEGVDLSREMLQIAKKKAQKEGVAVNFKKKDIRNLDPDRKFDAVISMFAVMGYQKSNRDFASALLSARKHLKPKGLFIFDVWFGPAVLVQKPRNVKKTIEHGNQKIIRTTFSALDLKRQLIKVYFDVKKIQNGRIIDRSRETHILRYFFQSELRYFLKEAGLKLKKISPFMKMDTNPCQNDWNISVVAEAG